MSVPLIRGVLTVILFGAFIALWIWAWSKQRKDEFDAAAQLALDEGQPADRRSEQ